MSENPYFESKNININDGILQQKYRRFTELTID